MESRSSPKSGMDHYFFRECWAIFWGMNDFSHWPFVHVFLFFWWGQELVHDLDSVKHLH